MARARAIPYHDQIVAVFIAASIGWALFGMLAGVWAAAELVFPALNFDLPWLTFGRLRTVHTNAVIFGFGGSALIGTAFYSVQRTCHQSLFAPGLAWVVFVGWQIGMCLSMLLLFAGINAGKEYAEMEWPLDIAVAVLWLSFALCFFGTIGRRRIAPIYISNWFYGALIIVVAMLHVVNNLALPVSWRESLPLYAGSVDAVVQWWYGHNAVGFFLTGGFLGMLYYFLPKQLGRPIWSYRLSVIAFWAFVYTYIWAGPHHLHFNAIPDWLQTLAMVMSLLLWLPSWATMVNGVMTISGAWHKLREDPALKFIVIALPFYGLATFEGPMLAIKSVNVVSHFTDWTVGHVHSGALGWNAFVTFGTLYFLAPKLAGRPLFSARAANIHFALGVTGVLLYIMAMWGAGIMQGLLWLNLDEAGEVRYSFVEIMEAVAPYYVARLIGGALFFAGTALMAWNLYMTMRGARIVQWYAPAHAEASAAARKTKPRTRARKPAAA
ncbi:MAG: cytochrome-c oxidase, cbb3-type subunit I [Gammaproteobacteria bacterium]|nr:cytochrome-c oxidase, cbb3-type subunit I [Gammaproteobacteria bacterium]CAJ2377701.1 MAG: Cbb3-type cytochrome c oxidase subunit CcoN1 [Arenicellales bacterium IbO2]MDA7961124.1 cytochrome-c oxidase, cbb3-type subunit I [Gammaproteobacteria bacterium]MDA7969509.1 cytochrome-c oxidase, cbb3-type subunit I [Gammaproteobacteria bacterium]MDA7971995.1 cytochrome-c oxidase, cbb3-type subunit I [Gammaproteobacteria bacterium]